MNEKGLIIGKDYNQTKFIFRRVMHNKCNIEVLIQEVLNILINLVYHSILNFTVIIYNYLLPLMVLCVQGAGYFDDIIGS